ncbi:MAG: 3-deoxy-D-manno-octulosonic acid transferase [Victivallaceae bacterium]|nr:3-deoxy-D-manno-octulosonic acid transferase [Victivallaceae bacterium]
MFFKIIILLYDLLLPFGFLAFLPGLIWKLIFRPGWKKTFPERFAIFSADRLNRWRGEKGGIWLHAVSVGETMIALSLIRKLLEADSGRRIILSTTTTTGQELARNKAPEQVQVIYAPIDFPWTVARFFRLLKVDELAIFETEIWPNMILQAKKRNVRLALVNARMSDHSSRGYRRFGFFFAPLLAKFDVIAAQSKGDADRFLAVSPAAKVTVTGNLKFDQFIDPALEPVDFSAYFGAGKSSILIGASTHPGEEDLLIRTFKALKPDFPALRLVLAPRHAERGSEVAALLKNGGLSFARRSVEAASAPVDVLLADTTGELVKLMKGADVVVMGKSFAGQDGGHNPIEPALLGKPVVTGEKMSNFRFVMKVLSDAGGVVRTTDAGLTAAVAGLLSDPEKAAGIGERGRTAIAVNCGATAKLIGLL